MERDAGGEKMRPVSRARALAKRYLLRAEASRTRLRFVSGLLVVHAVLRDNGQVPSPASVENLATAVLVDRLLRLGSSPGACPPPRENRTQGSSRLEPIHDGPERTWGSTGKAADAWLFDDSNLGLQEAPDHPDLRSETGVGPFVVCV